ncbi:MAG: DUF2141 domain-containing protein [Anderseniella sp.]|nr:DUF2141 domain-containing protein [Anderseniella sp.]
MNKLLAAIIMCLAGSLATPVMAADINVTISGIRNANGSIVACLWSSGWGFPNCDKGGSNVNIVKVPAQAGSVTFVFPSVEAGKYAISVAHDQNNDGKLERHRFLKYPLEGAGASNYLTPPRFAPFHHEALFQVQEPATSVTVPMHYPPE